MGEALAALSTGRSEQWRQRAKGVQISPAIPS